MNHLNHFLVQQQYEAAINTNYVTGPASNFYVSELYWRNSLHPSFMSLITGRKVSAKAYYSEYHGHRVNDLEKVLPALRAKSSRLIWTAGDSSLDNKYWVEEQAGAVGAYKDVLEPAVSKKDVTYWLNYHCHNSKNNSPRKTTAAINTAVEATTLNERTFQLRPQDIFIRDNIQAEDVLIVSIGGNDIAMMPTPCTIASIGSIVCMPRQILQNGFSFGYFPGKYFLNKKQATISLSLIHIFAFTFKPMIGAVAVARLVGLARALVRLVWAISAICSRSVSSTI